MTSPGEHSLPAPADSKADCAFTIFIPTYNRAYCLPRALASILESTCQDLEIIVVDDGSTDDTRSVVAEWRHRAPFPIRYLYQENAGKAAAHNRAVAEARGYFFLNVDSDDSLLPEALEGILREWELVPESDRARFSGIAGLLLEEDGSVSGAPYPGDRMDSDYLAINALGLRGDKREATRTEVLREFLYPIIPGERRIRPGLILLRMAHRYKTRFVNLPLVVGRREPDGISANIRRFRAENPRGMRLAVFEEITLHRPYTTSAKLRRNTARYVRYSMHSGIGLAQQAREAPNLWEWVVALPSGLGSWVGDKLRALLRWDERAAARKRAGQPRGS